jgi:hypothetical protein
MGVGGATFGGRFFLLGSSGGGEATGTLGVSWPVRGFWNDEGAKWPLIRGEGAGCVD